MKQSATTIALAVVVVFVLLMAVPLLGLYVDVGGQSPDAENGGEAGESTSVPEPTPTVEVVATGTATQTVTPTLTASPTPTPTATPTPTPTATPTSTPTATPELSLNGTALATAVATEVNDHRERRDLDALDTIGVTHRKLSDMAQTHAGNMQEVGYASHYYQGNNSADRYRVADLYSRCQFSSNQGGYLVTPDRDQLEVIGKFDATEEVARHDSPQAVYDAIAAALVERWFESNVQEEKLTFTNAEQVGVGATFTEDDRVYVALTLC